MTQGETGFHIQLTVEQKAKMSDLPYGYQKKMTAILISQLIRLIETNTQGEVLNGLEKGQIGLGFSESWADIINDLCDELRFYLDQHDQDVYTSSAYVEGMKVVHWMKGYIADFGKEGTTDAPVNNQEINNRDD